jgi:hypothetical protein
MYRDYGYKKQKIILYVIKILGIKTDCGSENHNICFLGKSVNK